MNAQIPASLPHSIDAEQALLGAVLHNTDAFDLVEGRVSADDFFEPVHRVIWEAFQGARRGGRMIDVRLTVAAISSVSGQEVAEGFTVGQYVARLAAEATTVAGAPDYARFVRETADLRRMIAAADALKMEASGSLSEQPAEIARRCIDDLDQIVAARSEAATRPMSVGEAASRAYGQMMHTKESGSAISGIPYGLVDLDDATLGMNRGEMILLGARPSVGKTATGLSIACKAASSGFGVAFFSLEMGAESLTERVLSDLIYNNGPPVTYRAIRAGRVDASQISRIERAALQMQPWPFVIDPQPGLTVGQIAARARKLKDKWDKEGARQLDLVVVDHVHLVKASERYAGQRTGEVTEISGALKALAKELDVAVLVLCQLNRGNESREDKRPQLSDLRDSGALEQDADVVLFIHRESYYLERAKGKTDMEEQERQAKLFECQNLMEIGIAKQRQGPIKIIEVFCDMGCNAIRNKG